MKKIVLILLLISTSAVADYSCEGKIAHFGLSDWLNVHNGFGVHRLCQLNEDSCKAWMSLALSAKVADKKVIIYYRSSSISGNQSEGACNNIGDWVTPNDTPYYLEIR